jgi:hypothetical protein
MSQNSGNARATSEQSFYVDFLLCRLSLFNLDQLFFSFVERMKSNLMMTLNEKKAVGTSERERRRRIEAESPLEIFDVV